MSFPTIRQISQSFRDRFLSSPSERIEDAKEQGHPGNLYRVSASQDVVQVEQQYFRCAQELREQGKYTAARSILHSLASHGEDMATKREARENFLSSAGERGSWFNLLTTKRHWSDERKASAPWDLAKAAAMTAIFTMLSSPIPRLIAFVASEPEDDLSQTLTDPDVLQKSLGGSFWMAASIYHRNNDESDAPYDLSFDHRKPEGSENPPAAKP